MFHLIWWLGPWINFDLRSLSFYIWLSDPSLLFQVVLAVPQWYFCLLQGTSSLSHTASSYTSVFSLKLLSLFVESLFSEVCFQCLSQVSPSSLAFPTVSIHHQFSLAALNFYWSDSWYKKTNFGHRKQSSWVRDILKSSI